MMNQSAELLWQQFKQGVKGQDSSNDYQSWAFGNSPKMADELLGDVLTGEKTGTSSLHVLFEKEEEEVPKVSEYSVILDGQGQAQAIIQTKVVEILPYNRVSEVHAYLEGEGERTLNYWRSVHQPFFEQECEEHQLIFSEEMLIIYEVFEVVYKR